MAKSKKQPHNKQLTDYIKKAQPVYKYVDKFMKNSAVIGMFSELNNGEIHDALSRYIIHAKDHELDLEPFEAFGVLFGYHYAKSLFEKGGLLENNERETQLT